MNIDDFWAPWEHTVDSFDQALTLIHGVFDDWSRRGCVFAWRGQVDASWGLHSSLYRRLMWTNARPLTEAELAAEEQAILAEAHRWGLHTGQHGRLSILSQLAMQQHYGAPTRLVDVTFNPLIGLWFAVEQQWDNGSVVRDDRDGRLFAIDVAKRLINENSELRQWEDNTQRPWQHHADGATLGPFKNWTKGVLAWRPARLDHRIAAQNGGFLLGGVPPSTKQHPKRPGSSSKWTWEEARAAFSLPLRMHKINNSSGRPPINPTYTIRIKASAKVVIRKHLQDLYGYRPAAIYPDYPGFSLFGRPTLKSRP